MGVPFTEQGSHLAVLALVSATGNKEEEKGVRWPPAGRWGRRSAEMEAAGRRGSDGQPEGADDAVHGLVLPPHGAAACGEKTRRSARGHGGSPS